MTAPQDTASAGASRTAHIRRLAVTDEAAAVAALAALLKDLFGLEATGLRINRDQYSLNSLNGTFTAHGEGLFFKFHQEDGEEAMTGEYYRADILARAGLPVDQPLHLSVLPGEQILIYRRRDEPRFSDVLRALDIAPEAAGIAAAVAAEAQLCDRISAVYSDSLTAVTADAVAAEPIHRLFHERLVEPVSRRYPGGRLRSFYVDQPFVFPGVELDWQEFSRLSFRVNGVSYRDSVGRLFDRAAERLAPLRLADAGGVVAHGDAHNANVWYGSGPDGLPELAFFDPAFAGQHVPSLLAEVKATFHNVFAHPFWLYDPAEAAARFSAVARLSGDVLEVETDFRPSALRTTLLAVKADRVWTPLLADLSRRGMLPADWREVIRLAMFLCPTLVMNLRAGAATHSPLSSLIAFSVAVMAGSPPEGGAQDMMTGFLDRIDPDR